MALCEILQDLTEAAPHRPRRSDSGVGCVRKGNARLFTPLRSDSSHRLPCAASLRKRSLHVQQDLFLFSSRKVFGQPPQKAHQPGAEAGREGVEQGLREPLQRVSRWTLRTTKCAGRGRCSAYHVLLRASVSSVRAQVRSATRWSSSRARYSVCSQIAGRTGGRRRSCGPR